MQYVYGSTWGSGAQGQFDGRGAAAMLVAVGLGLTLLCLAASPSVAEDCSCRGSAYCCYSPPDQIDCLVGDRCAAAGCPGDCDASGVVEISDLVLIVNVALGEASFAACFASDVDNSGATDVNDIVAAVGSALNGCGGVPTVTPTVPPVDHETMTWRLSDSCDDGRGLAVRFFDFAAGVVFPSSSEVYAAQSGETAVATIACTAGDDICFGARQNPDGGTYWGVDVDGAQSCDSCCYRCASTTVALTLTCSTPSTATMVWELSDACADGRGIQFRLFDENNNLVFPDGSHVYVIDSGGTSRASIACQSGAKICYGAVTQPPDGTYWGVGIDNTEGCSGCCIACQDGRVGLNLTCG